MVTLTQGQRIGDYVVGRPLGIGGFGRVYRGIDRRNRTAVALKVPAPKRPKSAELRAFRGEVSAQCRLRHPHILPVLATQDLDAIPVLVTPMGRGTLADRVHRPMRLRRALDYTRQMLLALAHLHRRHVLHCDVKPENLLFLADGRLVLADFGTARRGLRTVNADGSGTRGYMAPEQAAGRPSARSDVFAAGMVLATMLLGRRRQHPIPQLRARRRLPRTVLGLVERAIDPDPRRRYRDAGAMLRALRRIEHDLP